jgi:hypothetical protein
MRGPFRALEPLIPGPSWRDSIGEGLITAAMILGALFLVAALACAVVWICS